MDSEKEDLVTIDSATWTEVERAKNYAKLAEEEETDDAVPSEDSNLKISEKDFLKEPFDPDEWELVDEDSCVVELVGLLDKEYLHNCNKERVKLVDLFSEDGKTLLQLDQMIFVGEASETFGTNVIFEEIDGDEDFSDEENTYGTTIEQTSDQPRKTVSNMEYITSTRKKLSLNRAILAKK